MTTILLEQPVPILIVGLLAAAAAGLGFVSTGRLHFGVATLVILAVTALLLGVEQWVVTDNELIEDVIYSTGAAIAANDHPAVLSHVSPQSPAIVAKAKQHLSLVTVTSFRIASIKYIDVKADHRPPLAEAFFQFVISGKLASYDEGTTYPANMRVKFRREEDGVWRITRYEILEFKPNARIEDLRKIDEAGGGIP